MNRQQRWAFIFLFCMGGVWSSSVLAPPFLWGAPACVLSLLTKHSSFQSAPLRIDLDNLSIHLSSGFINPYFRFKDYWAKLGLTWPSERVFVFPSIPVLNQNIRRFQKTDPELAPWFLVYEDHQPRPTPWLEMAEGIVQGKVPISFWVDDQNRHYEEHDLFVHLPGYFLLPRPVVESWKAQISLLLKWRKVNPDPLAVDAIEREITRLTTFFHDRSYFTQIVLFKTPKKREDFEDAVEMLGYYYYGLSGVALGEQSIKSVCSDVRLKGGKCNETWAINRLKRISRYYLTLEQVTKLAKLRLQQFLLTP